MEMKKRRGVLSLLFVFLWAFLFVLGIYLVFLFLQGFTFLNSRVIQKGYASFTSEHPVYINGRYVKSAERYDKYEVGEYVVCSDAFEKKGQCYNSVEVGTNDGLSQRLNISFLKWVDGGSDEYALSQKNDLLVFSAGLKAVLWYDILLKQAFYVGVSSEDIEVVFPGFDVASVSYSEEIGGFVLHGKRKDDELVVHLDSDESFFRVNDSFYTFSDLYFSQIVSADGFFSEGRVDLKGVFSEMLHQFFILDENTVVLFFKESVYLFSFERNSFVFLSEKDAEGEGVCNSFMRKCFFMKDEKLIALPL